MRKQRSALVVTGLLVILLAAGMAVATGEDQPAKKPPAKETADARVQAAVGEIIDRVLGAKKGLRLGLPVDRIPSIVPQAAEILDEYYLPLEGSAFAPKGDWKGVVKLVPIDLASPLDEIRIALLVPEYDRDALLACLKKKAKAIGITDFARDRMSGPYTWWGTDKRNRDLWVGLGDGIVALEFTEL